MKTVPVRVLTGLLIAFGVFAAAAEEAGARLAGTVSVGSGLTFTSESQNVWGPGQSLEGVEKSFTLLSVSVPKKSPTYGSTVSQWGGTFGGVLKPSLEWSLGMTGRLYDFDSGTVTLKWPAQVTLTMDEPNSYGPGDTVTINSEYLVPAGGWLTATPPAFKVDLTGNLSLNFSASLEGCLGACLSYSIFPTLHLNKNFTLVRLTNGGLSFPDIPNQNSYAVPHLMSWCESEVTGVSGFLDFPNGYPYLPGIKPVAYVQNCPGKSTPVKFSGDGPSFDIQYDVTPTRDGAHRENFRQETAYRFVDVSVDLDGFADPTGLLGRSTPSSGGVYGSYDLLDLSSDVGLTYKQALSFEPDLKIRIDFPRAMTYRITGGEWQTATSALFPVGKSLELIVPEDQAEPWSNPTLYRLDNTFTSTTKITPDANLNYSAAKIEAHLPAGNFAETIMKEVCTCPEWDPTGVICLVSKVCNMVVDEVINHPYSNVNIGPHAIVDGKEIAGVSPDVSLRSYTGSLGGIAPQPGSPVIIDPENPRMQLAAEVSRVVNHGGGKRTVTYTMAIHNSGDVPLKDTRITDLLARAFGDAVTFSVPQGGLRSCDFAVNQGFGSSATGEMLPSPVILDDGRDPNPGPVSDMTGGVVQLEVDVQPGLYPRPFINTFAAAGQSWFRGTPVTGEAQAAVDLGPARLDELTDFALYADKKILMKEPALIKGSVGSNDAVEIQNGSNTLIAGDIRSLGTVDVHGAVTVDYIFTNMLLNLGASGRVNGGRYFDMPNHREINEYVTPLLERFTLPALAIEAHGPSVAITAKAAQSTQPVLAPGEYGTVTVAAGATVLFKSGSTNRNFLFRDLDIEDGATVLFDVSAGPLAVNIDHGMKIGRNVRMGIAGVNGSTRDISFNLGINGQINVGRDSQLVGTWLAPSASIDLGRGSSLKGALYADMIKMETGSRVEFHEEPWTGNLYKHYTPSCDSLNKPVP